MAGRSVTVRKASTTALFVIRARLRCLRGGREQKENHGCQQHEQEHQVNNLLDEGLVCHSLYEIKCAEAEQRCMVSLQDQSPESSIKNT